MKTKEIIYRSLAFGAIGAGMGGLTGAALDHLHTTPDPIVYNYTLDQALDDQYEAYSDIDRAPQVCMDEIRAYGWYELDIRTDSVTAAEDIAALPAAPCGTDTVQIRTLLKAIHTYALTERNFSQLLEARNAVEAAVERDKDFHAAKVTSGLMAVIGIAIGLYPLKKQSAQESDGTERDFALIHGEGEDYDTV